MVGLAVRVFAEQPLELRSPEEAAIRRPKQKLLGDGTVKEIRVRPPASERTPRRPRGKQT